MQARKSTAKDMVVAYIGGGSRGWAWGFMKDLAGDSLMCGLVKLYDIDKQAAENNRLIGSAISAHPDAKSKWTYQVANNLQDALRGADVVVISILPATFKEMAVDVHLPEKYGIYQSVGDTVGPGGMMRALRSIPMFEEIGEAIREYAPDAWVINYTNPMSICLRSLYHVYPGIKAFGCCHEVFGTQKLLARMVADALQIPLPRREDIHVGVSGINHFTWLYSASFEGNDLFPLYEEFARKYAQTGYTGGNDENWMNSFFTSNHRVKMDLFLRYGLIAAAGDRHLAEFVPEPYLRDPEIARSWGFSLTPVSWREEDLKRRLQRQQALITGEQPIDMSPSGEEGHLLIRALMGLGDMLSNVNIPNRGQTPDLPIGAIVETNAVFRRDEIAPMMVPALPRGIDALVTRHLQGQEALTKATLIGDWKAVLNVFLNDPQLSRLSRSEGEALFREMAMATATWLPKGLIAWLQ